jgi:hypothetical protein
MNLDTEYANFCVWLNTFYLNPPSSAVVMSLRVAVYCGDDRELLNKLLPVALNRGGFAK